MSWEIRQSGSADKPHCVHDAAGKSLACFPTESDAVAHVDALRRKAARVGPQDDLPGKGDGRSDGAGTRLYRVDAGRLAKAKRTPQGGIRAVGTIAIAKVLEYRNEDGTVRREYFPPNEAERAESLATLEVACLTHRHPPEMVEPANFKRYAVGHMVNPRAEDGKVLADLVVQDAAELDAIDEGDGELSAGYHCDVVAQPGETPQGERYDFVQRRRVYNHVGIGPVGWARAGSSASLHLDGGTDVPRLDAAGNCLLGVPHGNDPVATPVTTEERTMKFNIDGVDHDVPNETVAQAIAKALRERDAQIKDGASAIATVRAEHDAAMAKAREDGAKAQARVDALEAQAKDLAAKLAEATDPVKIAERAAAVAKVDADCRRLAPEVKLDGLVDPFAKMRAALKDARIEIPSDDDLKARGFDPATYVGSRFDGELARVPERDADRKVVETKLRAAQNVTTNPGEAHKDAYAEMCERRALENKNRPGQPVARTEG